ncbi:FecCD family ABC transporter permease [Brachybacterium sacelli]|uniref:Iron complex transport system permease protein n=1 Tax=Brachybacterium sacelli TaxID=173364 RepID=A0ABS4WX63_9MICO|nr:iron chelate uptake ABC transporter family permease subunit [Brachybacterium sacelli]MBP2380785.1 iron complex transport system permease protein [Brachybacterium sacelli]
MTGRALSSRPLGIGILLVAAILSGAVATLAWGELGIGPGELASAARGEAGTKVTFVLERLRGPRLLVGIGAGIAFGLAGALFQTVTRNPLGSPDVIGLGAGAGAGVALATLLAPGLVPAPVGALLGAAVAIGLVHVSTGLGFASPARVIITGIGVSAMALAVTQYVVAVALRDSSSQLAGYLVGTLNSRSLGQAALIGIALMVLIPAVALLSHDLRMMDLGDELADALGGSALRTRTAAILLAVLLAAAAVAVAGPIAFVALAAPHIARRSVGAPGPQLVLSALVGALIMVLADFTVQHVAPVEDLPVGVITAGVGGVYLGYLLLSEWKRSDA